MSDSYPENTVIAGYAGWCVTLDPGGFVVRDASGQAVEVFNSKWTARGRLIELSYPHQFPETAPLFTPAPAVMPGQLGLTV